MLNFRPSAAGGFSLIELMITLAVLGMLIMIALPNMGTWIQNTQIRTSAEGMQAGLQLARAEALKRNTGVRFQLVDTLTSACAVSATGRNWVVSLADASALCHTDASETVAPQIIQKRSSAEGSPNAVVTATGGSSVIFNGLGRAAAGSLTQINITNPGNGTCKTLAGNEPMRCLRITVNAGGTVRMCDPAVDPADITDPRRC
jgi:type IV fimbrial biogenesis protein FimT